MPAHGQRQGLFVAMPTGKQRRAFTAPDSPATEEPTYISCFHSFGSAEVSLRLDSTCSRRVASG